MGINWPWEPPHPLSLGWAPNVNKVWLCPCCRPALCACLGLHIFCRLTPHTRPVINKESPPTGQVVSRRLRYYEAGGSRFGASRSSTDTFASHRRKQLHTPLIWFKEINPFKFNVCSSFSIGRINKKALPRSCVILKKKAGGTGLTVQTVLTVSASIWVFFLPSVTSWRERFRNALISAQWFTASMAPWCRAEEKEETDGCVFSYRDYSKTIPCWPSMHGPGPDLTSFIAFPASSAIWLALIGSTCTFQILGAWNRGGGADGGLGVRCDLTLLCEFLNLFGWWRLTEEKKKREKKSTQNINLICQEIVMIVHKRFQFFFPLKSRIPLQFHFIFPPFLSLCSEIWS